MRICKWCRNTAMRLQGHLIVD